jgi:L-ascorbate metabolism protein UlaG (beta-lactamase superfamily)
MPYIGVAPSSGLFKKLDSITVVNNQAAYTMQHNSSNFLPATAEQLIVSVNGVIQAPGDAYTVSGSTITFSENLVTGDTIDFIVALGEVGNTVTPTDGSVDVNKMSSSIMKENAIRVNDTSLASGNNVTIAADENAMVAGPFTLNATLTINGTFTVV